MKRFILLLIIAFSFMSCDILGQSMFMVQNKAEVAGQALLYSRVDTFDTSSINYSIIVPESADLMVAYVTELGGSGIDAPSFNGIDMTLGVSSYSISLSDEIFYLIDPTSGTHTFDITTTKTKMIVTVAVFRTNNGALSDLRTGTNSGTSSTSSVTFVKPTLENPIGLSIGSAYSSTGTTYTMPSHSNIQVSNIRYVGESGNVLYQLAQYTFTQDGTSYRTMTNTFNTSVPWRSVGLGIL